MNNEIREDASLQRRIERIERELQMSQEQTPAPIQRRHNHPARGTKRQTGSQVCPARICDGEWANRSTGRIRCIDGEPRREEGLPGRIGEGRDQRGLEELWEPVFCKTRPAAATKIGGRGSFDRGSVGALRRPPGTRFLQKAGSGALRQKLLYGWRRRNDVKARGVRSTLDSLLKRYTPKANWMSQEQI